MRYRPSRTAELDPKSEPAGHEHLFRDCAVVEVPFADLQGFTQDNHAEAFQVFRRSSAVVAERKPCLREASRASAALETICRLALARDISDGTQARRFFETHFRAWRVGTGASDAARGFLTGYYEPVVAGSLTRGADFTAPILAPCDDLRFLPTEGVSYPGYPGTKEGRGAYPDRAMIEALAAKGLGTPIVWLRDKVEVFFVHVQGSARVCLEGGGEIRLVYAGRNGWPYTSIGRILNETGAMRAADMSLAGLKQWIRDHGQEPGDAGAALMQQNQSYVFFRLDQDQTPPEGPIGGQGIALARLRSVAIDRTIYSYGLPFWISAELPWRDSRPSPFRRLMIAQDTGSAIVGAARADIYFGSGDDAGARAGDIRHKGDFVVLLPKDEDMDR